MDAFDVGAYLGRGGFATVYRAVERATGRTVALKVVDTHKLREAGVDAERLEREMALHATCMNERVVTLQGSFAFDSRRDLGTEDDACDHVQGVCLVLEYCPGGDLRQLLKRKGRLTDAEARVYLKGVLKGLAYLHAKNIAHRDIKLSNVLLDATNQIKLCDFGVAASIVDGERWTLCGTPNYVAPEIVAGDQAHSTAVDLWSVGCLAHALLAGRPAPVQARARTALGGRPRGEDDDSLSATLSPLASAFVRRLLQEDPLQRPSAEQALRDPFLTNARPPLGALSPNVIATPHKAVDAWAAACDDRWEAKVAQRCDEIIDCSHLEFAATTPKQTVAIADGLAKITWRCAKGAVTLEASGTRVRVSASTGASRAYTRTDLPARFLILYCHLAKCVALVRSRTVRVACRYGAGVECALMANGPLCDVRLRWRDGCRARYSLATGGFELQLPDATVHAYTPSQGTSLPTDAPDARVALYLRDARSGVRKCLRAAQRFEGAKFPIVVDVRAPSTPRRRPPKKLAATSGRSTSSHTTQPLANLSFVSDLTAATRVAA